MIDIGNRSGFYDQLSIQDPCNWAVRGHWTSGLYIVTLRNDEPISVNANDPRIADKAIKVTRANCRL